MKYIVTKKLDDGYEEIFTFPDSVNHDCMAEMIENIRNQSFEPWHRVIREPVSAGFIENGECVGKSVSLGIHSRKQDTDILKRQ